MEDASGLHEQASEDDTVKKSVISIKSTKFDQEWVQVLINLRMKYAKLFTRRRNSASDGWKLVFEELIASGAPSFITIAKIKKKWMNLMTRFRQIKNSTLSPEKVTWPYFEQMNRAFGKDSLFNDEPERKHDSSLLNAVNNDERQHFIKKLIELRYSHKHLFTGKKYTARDGWIIIRSLLKCDEKYTVEQLSKCWQNLVQRYKQLSKSENTITWPYYPLMNDWYNAENNISDNVKIEVDASMNVIENEENDLVIDRDKFQISYELVKNSTATGLQYTTYEDILLHLNKIKETQEINHKEITNNLKYTQELLRKLSNEQN